MRRLCPMLALLSLASGCASVPAWERETLSHQAMQEGTSPESEAMQEHVAGAREGALDPGASGGGGCGCN